MIDLSEELTTGPLSSEILPYIETKNFDAILAAFNRKDIAISAKDALIKIVNSIL